MLPSLSAIRLARPAVTNATTSSFLHLPLELRLQFYGYYFDDLGFTIEELRALHDGRLPRAALQLTCKQIRAEVGSSLSMTQPLLMPCIQRAGGFHVSPFAILPVHEKDTDELKAWLEMSKKCSHPSNTAPPTWNTRSFLPSSLMRTLVFLPHTDQPFSWFRYQCREPAEPKYWTTPRSLIVSSCVMRSMGRRGRQEFIAEIARLISFSLSAHVNVDRVYIHLGVPAPGRLPEEARHVAVKELRNALETAIRKNPRNWNKSHGSRVWQVESLDVRDQGEAVNATYRLMSTETLPTESERLESMAPQPPELRIVNMHVLVDERGCASQGIACLSERIMKLVDKEDAKGPARLLPRPKISCTAIKGTF
jgi:hypothetical protein